MYLPSIIYRRFFVMMLSVKTKYRTKTSPLSYGTSGPWIVCKSEENEETCSKLPWNNL